MSVVSGTRRRRWAVVASSVALLVAALAGAPRAAGLLSSATPGRAEPPRHVLDRALGSADIPYTALSVSRGTLGLPDLAHLGDVAALLGGSSRTRVWWSSPNAWRVDVLSPTGEQGTYGTDDGVVSWDYERRSLVQVVGEPGARLPRAEDLLAPEATRRLLAGVGTGDRVEALPDERVAGRQARVVRIVPTDPRGTIGRADVWVDAATGLPLRLRVTDGVGGEALVSELTDVRIGAPSPDVVSAPNPPGVRSKVETAPDLAAAVDQRAPWRLPDRLAGLPASRSLLQGSATYGVGLVRFTVLPLPGRTARDILASAQSAGAAPLDLEGGVAASVTSSLLGAVVAQGSDFRHAYLIAGLVQPDVLEQAAGQLLADPPPERFG